MSEKSKLIRCPLFNKKFGSMPLNPKYCTAPGKCNYCSFFIKKECKGCNMNMEQVLNSKERE